MTQDWHSTPMDRLGPRRFAIAARPALAKHAVAALAISVVVGSQRVDAAEIAEPPPRATAAPERSVTPKSDQRRRSDTRKAKPCLSRRKRPIVVTQVRDARTLVLADGQVVVLKGVLPPSAADVPGANVGQWPAGQTTFEAVRARLAGQSASIIFAGRRDRYGRRAVHLVLTSADAAPIWFQEDLVREGLARFDPEGMRTRCAERLARAETAARKAKRGLWRIASYQPRSALQTESLLRVQSTFQIVEGRVRSAKSVRGRVFLNFGDNWRNDFTAAISKRQMRYFERLRIDPLLFEGRNVTVRGWIERYGGPFIDIRHTHQISVRSRSRDRWGRAAKPSDAQRQPDGLAPEPNKN